MSRMFWFAVGAGSGVYAMVKSRRAAERFTPAGITDQVAALGHGVRLFGAEVHEGMAEHETQLPSRLEVSHADGSERRAIPTAPDRAAQRRGGS